jgi:hypothetical protein
VRRVVGGTSLAKDFKSAIKINLEILEKWGTLNGHGFWWAGAQVQGYSIFLLPFSTYS